MSKQDGYASRTATDLERKYNFGQTFAEVYNLVSDARKVAEEAKESIDGLDQEAIFNLLTNFGEWEGVYRGEDDGVYINASFIKSGTLEGENLKVAAGTVEGELTAATIKADKISGGELDFNKVTAKNLEVNMGDIADLTSLKISANQISGGYLDFDIVTAKNLSVDAAQIKGTLSARSVSVEAGCITGTLAIGNIDEDDLITFIDGRIEAAEVVAGTLSSVGDKSWKIVNIDEGKIQFYSGVICDLDYGNLCMSASTLTFECADEIRFYMPNGRYFAFRSGSLGYYGSDGSHISSAVFE